MRHSLLISSVCASFVSLGAFASEKGSMSLSVSSAKIGQSWQTFKPTEGESTTGKTLYVDYLGESADAAAANLELGFHRQDLVFYFYPLGAQGEREFWLGLKSGGNFEWGLMVGGFARSYDKPKVYEGKGIKEEGLSRMGLFANYGFQMLGQDFDTSNVMFYEEGIEKYENSSENVLNSTIGLKVELLHRLAFAENITAGWGLNVDWSVKNTDVNKKKVATTTDLDIGLQFLKLGYSF